jgi:hypothetical protein
MRMRLCGCDCSARTKGKYLLHARNKANAKSCLGPIKFTGVKLYLMVARPFLATQACSSVSIVKSASRSLQLTGLTKTHYDSPAHSALQSLAWRSFNVEESRA